MNKKMMMMIAVLISMNVIAQTDCKMWDSLLTISSQFYVIKIPAEWRDKSTLTRGPEKYFEGSGVGLPVTYNGGPVIVTAFMVKDEGSNLDECKESCLNGYRANPDRVFPLMYRDGEEKIELGSGTNAYILNTRFYRKSKELNQSRFDLVVYSEKAKAGYLYTLSVQYLDENYKFERDYKLLQFAKKLFSFVIIK